MVNGDYNWSLAWWLCSGSWRTVSLGALLQQRNESQAVMLWRLLQIHLALCSWSWILWLWCHAYLLVCIYFRTNCFFSFSQFHGVTFVLLTNLSFFNQSTGLISLFLLVFPFDLFVVVSLLWVYNHKHIALLISIKLLLPIKKQKKCQIWNIIDDDDDILLVHKF